MSDPHVIEVDRLHKSFGSFRALDGFDLRVAAGEVHGFLGPNGAGKSTTIRVLLGLLKPSGGSATVFGQDPWHDAVDIHRRLAYVPGDVTLWPGLSGGQCIDVLATAHGGIRAERRAELIERFELDPTKKSRTYSKGNRQKVSLIAALALDVELLILDEPTSGLDPLMEATFQAVLSERTDSGCTVLLSSHLLHEVQALADRVTIIRDGRTVSTGSLDDLRATTRSRIRAVTGRTPLGLESLDGIDVGESTDGVEVTGRVEPHELDALVGRLHEAGVRQLTIEPPSLDELFMHVYAGSDTAADRADAVGAPAP